MLQMTDDVYPGDIFMLCSDGLTDMLPDEAISVLLEQDVDADTLCDAAIKAGGFDNVSCCVISIK